jgi:hypothetical protein
VGQPHRQPHSTHVPLDAALGDGDSQGQQLASDTFCSPGPGLSRHAADERNHVVGDLWLCGLCCLLLLPIHARPIDLVQSALYPVLGPKLIDGAAGCIGVGPIVIVDDIAPW